MAGLSRSPLRLVQQRHYKMQHGYCNSSVTSTMEVVATYHTVVSNLSSNTSMTTNISALPDHDIHGLLEKFRSDLYRHREPITIVLISLYLPIFLVAFLGNLLVLMVILPNKHMRSLTNCFIVNLAISDMLVTVVCIPMAIGQSIYKPWIYGSFMCKITGYLQGVSVSASVFTIMMLSVDRYLAIRHPMTFRTYSNSRHALRVVLVIWLLSFAIMIPLIIVRKVDTVSLHPAVPLHFCKEDWRTQLDRQLYDSFLFIFMFIMPGCFVTVSYSRLGCQLWSVSQQAELYSHETKLGKQQANHIMASRRQVARMLVFIAVLFALCWMPCHILSLYIDFVSPGEMLLQVLDFTIWLGHSNSALNPVLYCFMNNSFRRYTARVFHCHRRKRRKPPDSPVDLVVCYSKMNGATRTSMRMTRRPLIRILSGSSTATSRSTSGSLRFSRSTNTSVKSSNTSANTINIRTPEQRRSPDVVLEKSVTPPSPLSVSPSLLSASSLHGSAYGACSMDSDDARMRYGYRSRREIFNYTLSIPTTINEESSRYSRTPSPHAERFTFRSLSEEFELHLPQRSPPLGATSTDKQTDTTDARGRHNSEDSGHVTMTEDSTAAARTDQWLGSEADVIDFTSETDKLLDNSPQDPLVGSAKMSEVTLKHYSCADGQESDAEEDDDLLDTCVTAGSNLQTSVSSSTPEAYPS